MTDYIQDNYNKLDLIPLIPHSIVAYLIDNNELLFKLLKYNTADAWSSSNANLTREEKGLLIYDGIKKVEDCRIFLDTGQDSAITSQISSLRISVVDYVPYNHVIGYCVIGVEVYCHYLINTLSDYTLRCDRIMQQVISTINGADIPNTSRLYFDASKNSKARLSTIGTSPYKGKLAILSTWAK